MRSDLISLMNCPSNTTLSSEVIRLLRITALCVIFYDAAVIKVIFKLTCYQWHSLIFTHVLCILRIGFCLRSKLPYGSFYTLVSVGKTRVKAPTVLRGDPSVTGEALAMIHLIIRLSLRALFS